MNAPFSPDTAKANRLTQERANAARLGNALEDYYRRIGNDDAYWLLKLTDAAQLFWPDVDFSEAIDTLKHDAGVRDEGDDLVPLSKLNAMGAERERG